MLSFSEDKQFTKTMIKERRVFGLPPIPIGIIILVIGSLCIFLNSSHKENAVLIRKNSIASSKIQTLSEQLNLFREDNKLCNSKAKSFEGANGDLSLRLNTVESEKSDLTAEKSNLAKEKADLTEQKMNCDIKLGQVQEFVFKVKVRLFTSFIINK